MYQNHHAQGSYSRQVFKTFISGLSKQQKKYLYNKQLEKAYEYQAWPRDAQALGTQSALIKPRVIVSNMLGENCVLATDVSNGRKYNMNNQMKRE
jgi:phage-related protein